MLQQDFFDRPGKTGGRVAGGSEEDDIFTLYKHLVKRDQIQRASEVVNYIAAHDNLHVGVTKANVTNREREMGLDRVKAAKITFVSNALPGEEMSRYAPHVQNYVREDAPANGVGGGAIAGIGVGPQGEPPGRPKRKRSSALFRDFLKRRREL